ncbi:MAG: phosphate ABC transporter substrate-binding protein [Desulfobacteraceae bacterium]|nr:phosphate ABC transporter substrate-binding protein [Desulfobacteraceae bacterium]
MFRRITFVFLCLCTAVFSLQPVWAGSSGLSAFDGLSGRLTIAGGTAHIPVMKQAARQIMRHNPDIAITVAGGGSGVGVQKVGAGLVDIGNTGRALSDEERDKFGLKSYAFAVDGVGLAVHPDNPLNNLSKDQVKGIFAGEIGSWKQVGGADRQINLYTRDEASGTRSVFWKKALDKDPVAVEANVIQSNGAMKVAISRDPDAIGYLSIGHMDDSVSGVAIDGVSPTRENAKDGSYPVVRKLYMNTKGEPGKLARAFIDYLQGPRGGQIVSENGFIPGGQ